MTIWIWGICSIFYIIGICNGKQLNFHISYDNVGGAFVSFDTFLARLFYKTEEVLSPPARHRLRQRLRPVKFWGKLLRQKLMSSFILSLTQNLFIFAVLIHMVVLIDNQALIDIHLYYFSYFFHVFGNIST